MAQNAAVHMALFEEDQLEDAVEAIHKLREMGIRDKDISVISGIPYSDRILGRPMTWTRVPLIAMAGAAVGFLAAVGLYVAANIQYPLVVGGMSPLAIPTSIVVVFELTMLGLLISTFIGVFIETISPSFGPGGYSPRISDGQIGVLFTSHSRLDPNIHSALTELGAEIIHPAEAAQK